MHAPTEGPVDPPNDPPADGRLSHPAPSPPPDRSRDDFGPLLRRVGGVALAGALLTGFAAYGLSSLAPDRYESTARVQFVDEERYEYRDGERDRLVGTVETPDVERRLDRLGATSVAYGIPARQTFIDVSARAPKADQAADAANYVGGALADRSREVRIEPLERQIRVMDEELATADPRLVEIDRELDRLFRAEGQAESGRFLSTPEETARLTVLSREVQRSQTDLNRERDALLDRRTGMQSRIAQARQDIRLATSTMRVVRPAVASDTPISPRPLRNAATVAFLTAAAIGTIGVLRDGRAWRRRGDRSPTG